MTYRADSKSGFDLFEHAADVGVRGWGPGLPEAFVQAAKALFSLMVDDLQSVRPIKAIPITARGYDRESLLVAWLNALLTASDVHSLLFTHFEVSLEQGFSLHGQAQGEPFAAHRQEQGLEVKGATFCQVGVYEQEGVWVAQCVVDV